ncbi:hypothetical protein WA171_000966 [Blastocystis sp. BT1]
MYPYYVEASENPQMSTSSVIRHSTSRQSLTNEALHTSTHSQSEIDRSILSPSETVTVDDSAQLTVSVYDDKSDEQTLVRASQVVVEQSSQYKLDGVTGLYQTSVIASAPQQGYVQEETLNAVDYAPILFVKSLPLYSSIDSEFKTELLPPRESDPKFTVVLDLDETLVHCSTDPLTHYHAKYTILWEGHPVTIYARIRPYAKELLSYCSSFCEVIVFTASVREYADKMLDVLDPEHRFIKYRLFRDSCTFINGNYVKDLNRLGRRLERTVIVDNSISCFGYHIENGIPIRPWYNDWEDRELYNLATYQC